MSRWDLLVDEFEEKMQEERVQGNDLFFFLLRKWIKKAQCTAAEKILNSERNKKMSLA